MSEVETLRRAATALRRDYGEEWQGATDEAAFMLAVADLLDTVAQEWVGVHDIIDPEALVVALAYLGESA